MWTFRVFTLDQGFDFVYVTLCSSSQPWSRDEDQWEAEIEPIMKARRVDVHSER